MAPFLLLATAIFLGCYDTTLKWFSFYFSGEFYSVCHARFFY